MNILPVNSISTHTCWSQERDESITVVVCEDSVLLLIKSPYNDPLALTMTPAEAKVIAADLLVLAPTLWNVAKPVAGAACARRSFDGSPLTFSAEFTTDGEPYREGVTFSMATYVEAGNYFSDVISIDFDSYACHELALALGGTATKAASK